MRDARLRGGDLLHFWGCELTTIFSQKEPSKFQRFWNNLRYVHGKNQKVEFKKFLSSYFMEKVLNSGGSKVPKKRHNQHV